MPLSTPELLRDLGYEFYSYEEEGILPELTDVTFRELLPSLGGGTGRSREIADKRLYKHQLEAYRVLSDGCNLILVSGTGSGKTEAWLLYVFRKGVQALALYPTLALANDQVRRINDYSSALGVKVMAIDARRRDELRSSGLGRAKLRDELASSRVVVTNPAFLLQDVKRLATNPRSSIFYKFLGKMSLMVVDEFDFYGPREIALLLSMMRILRKLFSPFQIAILTATLGNPQELAELLSEINGRPSRVVTGKPFRVANRVVVVLGKDLKAIWEKAREYKEILRSAKVGRDVLDALDDFERFKAEVYKVVTALEALGAEIPKPYVDLVEVLSKYVDDEGVTLVFTRSIARAEELARRLRHALPRDKASAVATHHHLVLKSVREEVEEGARRGTVRVIFTPRTLSQGIDIGTVVRVVHVGLPDSLREFKQREGRKGRREGLPFTETVVIPSTPWDRELLSRGLKALESWLRLPLEHVVINKDNRYSLLFEGLFKVISPSLGPGTLSREEFKLLESLGLTRDGQLTAKGKRTWQNLNFYEFAPPYGIKRMKVEREGMRYLEDISFCDLVEKFQPGCFDYTADAVVTTHKLGGKSGRVVTAVIEEPISESTLWRHDAMAYALEEYEKVKRSWGEEPNFYRDYIMGKVHSEVVCVVHPPREGFGEYRKIPNRVSWRVEGERVKTVTSGGKTYFIRERRYIEVPTATHGRYSDFTYGLTVELEPEEDLTMLRIGLAYLMVILRVIYRIPFETILYDLSRVGELKLLSMHEPEAAGLLARMDWLDVKRKVEEYTPGDVDEVLMRVVDEDAHFEFVAMGLRWDLARAAALRVLDYLLLRERIVLTFKDAKLYVPRPSRSLRLAAVDALALPLDDEGSLQLILVGIFDGEGFRGYRIIKEYYTVEGDITPLSTDVINLVNEGFSLLTYDADSLHKALSEGGVQGVLYTMMGLASSGRFTDVKSLVTKRLGIGEAPFEEVIKGLGWGMKVSLGDVLAEYSESRRRIREVPRSKWLAFTKYLTERALEYLRERTEKTYLLNLALSEVR